jgi:hypothetical protein
MLFIRLSVVSLLSFAIGTIAAPVSEAAAVKSIYEIATDRLTYEVEQLSVKLDNMLSARPGDRSAVAATIKEQVTHVLHASADGAASMRNAKPATASEAYSLSLVPGSVNQLTSATMAGAQKWIRIKDIVFQTGGQGKVIEMLGQMKTAGAQFAAEMNTKMPYGTQTVGKTYGDAADRALSSVIKEYQSPPRSGPVPGW